MKHQILIFTLAAFSFSVLNAQIPTELWGTATQGGDGYGAMYKTDANGNNQMGTPAFLGLTPGNQPNYVTLCEGSNGKLYGTAGGGINNQGLIFEYDPATDTYTKKMDFNGTNGSEPTGALVKLSNGLMYGVTTSGGTYGMGTLFQYNPTLNTYVVRVNFNGTVLGSDPEAGLMLATNGKLYGMTMTGGTYDLGVLYEFNPVGNVMVKKINFNGAALGSYPVGTLVQAANGRLYGMTNTGGTNDFGTLFDYSISSNVLVKRFNFNGASKGSYPHGGLVEASDGNLYGMTLTGGFNDQGTIFRYSPSSTLITKYFDFSYTATGAYPKGSLLKASNGILYGVTSEGGTSAVGALFQFDVTTHVYTKEMDFSPIANGAYPQGTLIQAASNGKLYGLTSSGGTYGMGTLFDYDITNDVYVKELEFDGGADGSNPIGTLLLASNGKLYGTAKFGGLNGAGSLYEVDPSINGGVVTKLVDFDWDNILGRFPMGEMIEASNGKLYGMTCFGGSNDMGVMYEFDPATNAYAVKMNFDGANLGSEPEGGLIQATDGKLYGLTALGGVNDKGVMFQYDLSTDVYTKLLDFDGTTSGGIPRGSLLQASNNKLYGTASYGGPSVNGTFFEFNISTNTFTKKFDFGGNTSTGKTPTGNLVQAPNGKIYGITQQGGFSGLGIIFEYDTLADTLIKKLEFDGPVNGGYPYSGLTRTAAGKLFGTTSAGGANSKGTMYEYNDTTNALIKKFDFDGNNTGSYPWGSLAEVCQSVYLTTQPSVFSLCENSPLTINSGASGSGYTYQWYHNGALDTGATSSAINFSSAALTDSGYYFCQVSNACRSAFTDTVKVFIHPIQTVPPVTPGAITGPGNVCSFIGSTTNASYSVVPVSGGPTYNWTVPTGGTIMTGQGTPNITVKYTTAFAPGNVTVQTVLTCGGSSPLVTKAVQKVTAAVPGPISGPKTNLCAATNYTYSVPIVLSATSYTWIVAGGVTSVSGQGTNSIVVTLSTAFASGSVSCKSVNQCSSSATTSIAIVKRPTTPGVITGTKNICAFLGVGSVTYSIAAVAGITTYTWTVPTGVTINSGQGTTSINVSYPTSFTTGNITVACVGTCINSLTSTLAVTYLPATPVAINGDVTVCAQTTSQTPVMYSIAAVSGASSYNWIVPAGATLLSGQGTVSISVTFDSSTAAGALLKVAAINSCATGMYRTLSLTTCNGFRMAQDTDSVSAPMIVFHDLNIYPNPTTELFNIQLVSDEEKEISIQIYDATGRLLSEKKYDLIIGTNLFNENVSGLNDGTYFVRLVDAASGMAETRPIVKLH